MMAKKYVSQMTLITKEILEQGRADAGASISGEMLKNGNLDFVKIWNEARKADDGEVEKDPKSVKEQVKEAVGSVIGNAKGMTVTMSTAYLYSPISTRLMDTQSMKFHQLYPADPLKPFPYVYTRPPTLSSFPSSINFSLYCSDYLFITSPPFPCTYYSMYSFMDNIACTIHVNSVELL